MKKVKPGVLSQRKMEMVIRKMKNTPIPVRMDEKANAAIVVAITARGLSSPISSAIPFAIRWKNGWDIESAK